MNRPDTDAQDGELDMAGPEPKTIGVTEFKQHCLKILEELRPEGLVITKRGRPLARVTPERRSAFNQIYGSLRGRVYVNPGDDLFSTGAWTSDEWGDANNGRAAFPDDDP